MDAAPQIPQLINYPKMLESGDPRELFPHTHFPLGVSSTFSPSD